jgi:hypothetical protein
LEDLYSRISSPHSGFLQFFIGLFILYNLKNQNYELFF